MQVKKALLESSLDTKLPHPHHLPGVRDFFHSLFRFPCLQEKRVVSITTTSLSAFLSPVLSGTCRICVKWTQKIEEVGFLRRITPLERPKFLKAVDGIIQQVVFKTLGASIPAGRDLFTIIPDHDI